MLIGIDKHSLNLSLPLFHFRYNRGTGWSISILYNLTGWYDKNNVCTKKIVVDLFSVYRDISSKTNNFKISKFLLGKKLNLKLGSILAPNSTYNFEGV